MISINKLIAIYHLVFLFVASNLTGQESANENFIYDKRVKTARIYRVEWNLSNQIIELGSSHKLLLEFDLLGNRYEDLYYSFVHCNKDWQTSELSTNDFLNGLPENPIIKYEKSFNTATDYFHYSLEFPNEDANLTRSGNYIIVVHRQGDTQNPLLTLRFMITENLTAISAAIRQSALGEHRNTHQQVDVSVSLNRLRVADPHSEIYTTILQNGRWDNAKTNLKADFISANELRYNSLSGNTLFYGGNEFRQFDIRSLRYQTEFVRDITFDGKINNVNLAPSENREYKPYTFRNDFNGKYVIDVQEGRNAATDADYALVYFSLPAPQPVQGGKLFIAGELTMWKYSAENIMTYNADRSAYEGSLFLKQGWYNYEFEFIPEKSPTEQRRYFEGSHFETENEYLILVYYKSRGGRYDRLVGTYTVKIPAG